MDTLTIENFGGLRTDIDPSRLAPGEACAALNVMTHRGDLRVRPGRVAQQTLPTNGIGPVALCDYATDDTAQLLAAAGGTVYAGGAATDLTFTGTRPRLAQFKDAAYLVDGTGNVKCWHPTDGVKELVQVTNPWQPIMQVAEVIGNKTIVDMVSGNDTGDGHGQWNSSGKWYTSSFGALRNQFKAEPYKEFRADEMRGMTCRLFHTQKDESGNTLPAMVGMEIIGKPTDDSFSAEAIMRQYVNVGTNSQGLDLSAATLVELTYKVLAGNTAMPQIKLYFGEDDVIGNAATITIDNTGDQVNTWITKQVDLTVLLPAQLNAIKWIGIQVSCGTGTRETTRQELTSATFLHDTSTAVTLLLSEFSANISSSNFNAGTSYDLCYTLTYGDEESAPSPIRSHVINTNTMLVPTDLQVTIPRMTTASDGTALSLLPDWATFYARGGVLGAEFVKIQTIPVTDATKISYTFDKWDGTVGDITVLNQYCERPPAECRLLFPHKGRMLYVGPNSDTKAYDTLFISNWDDAAHVPQSLTLDTPPLFGGWIVIGEDGQEITGLGTWGSYCLIFKRKGIYQLSGDTASDFAVTPVSVSHGCIAHETIAQIDDGMTVWLDHNHVWAITPQGIQNIGVPIERLLQGYPIEQQQNAFAVFDKGRGWYLLTIPQSGTLSSTTFVLARADSGQWVWSLWDGQPGGCAIYATHQAIPGTYAGDPHTGTLFLLNAGCSDDGSPIAYCWISKEFAAAPGSALILRDVYLSSSDDVEEIGEQTMTACRVAFDVSTPEKSREMTFNSSLWSRWRFPLHPAKKCCSAMISGESSTGGIVQRITMGYDTVRLLR